MPPLYLSELKNAVPWGQVAKASGGIAAAIAAVMVYRAYEAGKRRRTLTRAVEDPLNDAFQAKKESIAEHLSKALQFPTVSYDRPLRKGRKPICSCHDHLSHEHKHQEEEQHPQADGKVDPRVADSEAAFLGLHKYLQKTYPKMHATLERHVINKYSLCFVWRGSEPNLQATSLYSHLDVVPVEDASLWAHPPFSGAIATDPSKPGKAFVCGRGAIDDKQGVIGTCEAIEHLCSNGFKPRRTIIVSFGHDEEIGGEEGAAKISEWIAHNVVVTGKNGERIKPIAFHLDEGLFVLQDMVPGLPKDTRTAMICCGEKGYVNAILDVEVTGGHASTPPKDTAAGILSRAITRLEANPFPAKFSGPARVMFEYLTPYFGFLQRLVFANLWLTAPLVTKIMTAKPTTATLVRTTTAATIMKVGHKMNTLSPTGQAVVNHRIHPDETVDSVLARDAKVINDPRIKISSQGGIDPSPTSDDKSEAFKILSSNVESLFVNTLAAPALMVGATDSPWSIGLAEQIFRHCPTELHATEVKMFHGRDERIEVSNLARIACYYAKVILDADKANLGNERK